MSDFYKFWQQVAEKQWSAFTFLHNNCYVEFVTKGACSNCSFILTGPFVYPDIRRVAGNSKFSLFDWEFEAQYVTNCHSWKIT